MGRSGLSSKRKHSKKKSLKDSSEGRRKKRSSRNKSKKLHRHDDDSFSSSDDDASTSSSLVSSSSSEGGYKSRRSRSHTRNELKGSSRKRSRKRSLSEDSGKDSPLLKKRKRSKKKNKKIKKKKKSRRDAYISSETSHSASCSTCGDGNSSDDERASLGRRRSRSREKKKNHRDSNKGRKGNRKNRSRSRSCSPSKLSNSFDDEKMMVENNSRRLKSIITIAKPLENEEDNDIKRDELKEEIVYDYDDYPSCKSNDSNDGDNKKELVDRSSVSPEKKRMLTSVIGEVNSSSSLKDNKPVSPSNASGNIGSEVDNLESILRQKALENLSRFRGGLQTKTVVSVDNKHKSDQIGVKQSIIQTPMAVPQPVIPRSRFTWRREEKAASDSGTESGKSKAPAPKLQTVNLSSPAPKLQTVNLSSPAPKLQTVNLSSPAPKLQTVNLSSPAPKLQTVNLSSTLSVENKISKVMEDSGNDVGGIETNDGRKETTTGLENKEGSSKEQQNESNNSQFEKKTMSVMRGGEMVQVSYKVYIPTRAPALARRQLKR